MTLPQIFVVFFDILVLIPTLASLTRFDQWWIRGFDFPRLQISVLILVAASLSVWILDLEEPWPVILLVLLILSFFYQAVKIYPYTFFAKKQVLRFHGEKDDTLISILVSNVLMTNTKYQKLIGLVRRKNPDILLTLETDKTWEEKLSVIEKDYPHSVKIPKDNLYGMHLYSKLELEDIEIKYLVTDEIPSIHGKVVLRSGDKVSIHCLHPKPPSPSEDDTSTNRDAELLLVGKEVADEHAPLVFGDLNDVAWSRTTKLFLRRSGLLDPRIGRGFYNTFHTGYPIFRWPLDHVFHSSDFCLVELERLENIGSDHFPIFITLNYEPRITPIQDKPEAVDEEEEEWIEEKIVRRNEGEPPVHKTHVQIEKKNGEIREKEEA